MANLCDAFFDEVANGSEVTEVTNCDGEFLGLISGTVLNTNWNNNIFSAPLEGKILID